LRFILGSLVTDFNSRGPDPMEEEEEEEKIERDR
jgi:hypothetical protein